MSDNIQPEPEKKKRRDVQSEHNSDSGERKVKCPHCSKPFNKRSNLTRRINSLHSLTSSFKCAKCAREFSRKD